MNFEEQACLSINLRSACRCRTHPGRFLCSASVVAARVANASSMTGNRLTTTLRSPSTIQLTEITAARAEISVLTLKDKVSVIDLDFGELEIDSVTIEGRAATIRTCQRQSASYAFETRAAKHTRRRLWSRITANPKMV